MSFTEEQQAIINHSSGHALVNAVAGSGKTTVMVSFIEKLASAGIDPKKVLVLMFNKTAREDFQNRLRLKMAGSSADFDKDRLAEIRTLSSLSYKTIMLLQSSEVIPEYRILVNDARLQNPLIKAALNKHEVKETSSNIQYLIEVIEWIKSRHDDEVHYMGKTDCIEVRLFHEYEKLRHEAKLRFSVDWSYDTVTAVKQTPDLLHDVLNSRFEYVIVDEFQDINACQMDIINYFVGEDTKIMVVGDVNQSIYAWRGSSPDIMLKNFPAKYQPTEYQLTQTFRFGSNLAEASNNLIAHNKSRFEFDCVSASGTPDTKVHILQREEYKPSKLIKSLAVTSFNNKGEEEKDYSNIAILGRERCYWFETELDCLKNGVPYQLMTGEKLCVLDTLTIQSFIGYLRLAGSAKNLYGKDKKERKKIITSMLQFPSLFLVNEYKQQLINRLVDAPDSYQIFPDIKKQLKENLKVDDKVLKQQCDAVDLREEIWDVCLGVNAEKSNAVRALKLIYGARELNFKNAAQRGSMRQKDTDYKLMLLDGIIDLAEHIKDEKPSINAFLSYIDSLHNSYLDNSKKNRPKCVTVTTMHRSKGLEWDNIIIPDLYNSTMPVLDDDNNAVDEESDRRLLYVAMTRAKKNVYLVGDDGNSSKFLAEIRI